MTTPSCPDATVLLQLLDGDLPAAEQAELTQHLDGCRRCQQAVQDLASGGRSWSETAALLSGEQPGSEPALRRAVQELAGDGEPEPTLGDRTTADEPSAADANDLFFLAPSDKPGHLGRLSHYEILEVVGRGGMGVVLKAFDEKLHRVVAVKVLAPQLAVSGTARKRFNREATAAAAVAHEHVVAIHAVEGDAPIPYLVMQFVAGMSVEDRIRQGGPVDLKEVLRIGMQVAAGLAAAHAQGLVHRDVKPANILLENGVQRVKITDFGLARAADDASLTQSGVIAGTPLFMSPEQARGEALDHRSDLFSLGSVLYALCTGRPPFRAANTMAVLKRVCEDTPRPLREINADVPDWLAAIVMKLLAKEPAQRFQTAAEVAELLGQHLAHLQQPHLVARPPSVVTARHPVRRRRRLAVALLVAMVPVVAGVSLVGAKIGWSHLLPWGVTTTMRVERPERNEPFVPQAEKEALFVPRPLPAAAELAKRPCAADARKRDDIPADLREKLPPEVVAVLGHTAFALPDGDPSWMATDRDGKMLAVPCGDKVVLFDAHSGRHLRTLFGSDGRVFCAAFSPDGKRLAAGNWDDKDHTIRSWNTETGDAGVGLGGHTGNVNAVAYSPDGKRFVSASSDGTAIVWDEEKDGPNLTLRGHDGPVFGAAFSPNGKRVATAGEDRTVRVWDAETGGQIVSLTGHTVATAVVAFSLDGKLLAGGSENELKLWDADTFKEVRTVETPAAWLAFAPDGKSLLTGRHNNSGAPDAAHVVKRWDLEGKELASFDVRGKGGWAAYGLSADGKTLFEVGIHTADRALRAYNTETGAEQQPGHVGQVNAVAVSPGGKQLASAGADGTVRRWELSTGYRRRTLTGHRGEVRAVAFSPDGKVIASGGRDGVVFLWDSETGKQVGALPAEAAGIEQVAFSPDSRLLVSAVGNGQVRVWELANRTLRFTAVGDSEQAWCVAFSADGKTLLAGGEEGVVRFFDVASGGLVGSLPAHVGAIRWLGLAPDGVTLAVSGQGGDAVQLWDLATRTKKDRIEGQKSSVTFGAWHPDGRRLATAEGTGGTLRLWDLGQSPPRAREIRLFPPGMSGLHGVAFTPEGRHLVTANPDGTLYVVRLAPPAD